MFQELRTKYIRFLLPCVALIFSFYGLISFLIYQHLINNDYRNKILYFTEKQADNISSSLKLAERNMDLFLIRNNPARADYINHQTYSDLKRIVGISLDVSRSFYIDSYSIYHYPTVANTNDSLSFFIAQNRDLFQIPDNEFNWFVLTSSSSYSDQLLCTKTVQDNDGNLFTVGIVINVESILPDFSSNSDTLNIFSKSNFSALLLCDSKNMLFWDTSSQKISNDHMQKTNLKYDTFTKEISGSPFTLSLTFSREMLSRNFVYLFLGILIICILLFFASYLSLTHFLKKLTAALTSIYYCFSELPDSMKDGYTDEAFNNKRSDSNV